MTTPTEAHPIFLHDSASGTKRRFVPEDSGRVRMYVCGPTVYASPHVGNARPVVVFDLLFRLLRRQYGEDAVRYVRNITDVDDKIIAGAAKRGIPIETLTREVEDEFHEQTRALNALTPTEQPRATEYIQEMQALVARLLERGFAYEAEGHVLFEVKRWPDYGSLAHRDAGEMRAGARVETEAYKRGDGDFVLWKPAAPDAPGWDSPWGRGRPGWHIECSAMSAALLGERFDLHGGGQDLLFPHHENECAQSRAAFGTDSMARFWMHNGYVLSQGKKMSKSLGNVLVLRDLLVEFPGEAVRLALLAGHYRQPLDITRERLGAARERLERLYRILAEHAPDAHRQTEEERHARTDPQLLAALRDDLHTPRALARLGALAEEACGGGGREAALRLAASGHALGLLGDDPSAGERTAESADSEGEGEIQRLVAARAAARGARDWAEADRIRDELARLGVQLEDKQGETRIVRRR